MPADIVGSAMKANVSHVTMTGDRRLFGTDGIRGKANTEPMTAGIALRLGQAAGLLFTRGNHRHRVVIGKDTRLSGYMIEPALTAGFIGAGHGRHLARAAADAGRGDADPIAAGRSGRDDSASHNPYEDNGIKLFGPDGNKLSDETEVEIEALMESGFADRLAASQLLGRAAGWTTPRGVISRQRKPVFRAGRGWTACGSWSIAPMARLTGWRPTVLWELGATVIPVGVSRRTASTSTRAAARRCRIFSARRCWSMARISASRWMATPTA